MSFSLHLIPEQNSPSFIIVKVINEFKNILLNQLSKLNQIKERMLFDLGLKEGFLPIPPRNAILHMHLSPSFQNKSVDK